MRPWSCDTFVAMPDATVNAQTVMAKNSDRVAFESQPLRFFPRRSPTGTLRLTYVDADENTDAFAHLGSSPYWCWGHELGLNEWGVAIGNEAQFTRDLAVNIDAHTRDAAPPEGIIGMELVRLGLERGRTAEEALTVMTGLLEQHGQWGSAVPTEAAVSGAYDNSYLLADAREAWVLETSGHRWVARPVRSGTYAISNQPTIRTEFDRASSDLVDHAVDRGYWPRASAGFDYARAYTDPLTPLQVSHIRLQRSRQLLREYAIQGGVDVDAAKRILRDHFEDTFLDGPNFTAALPDFHTICMHDHPAGFTWGNTTTSAVFVLPDGSEGLAHMWWTPGPPCIGVYLPVFVAASKVPDGFAPAVSWDGRPPRPDQVGQDTYDPDSYWWRFKELLELAKGDELGWDFPHRQPVIRDAFDELEARWAQRLPTVEKTALELHERGEDPAPTLAAFTNSCARQALDVLEGLVEQFASEQPAAGHVPLAHDEVRPAVR